MHALIVLSVDVADFVLQETAPINNHSTDMGHLFNYRLIKA